MPAALLLARVTRDRLAAWRVFHTELAGPRRGEWAQSQRRRGIDREAVWLIRGDDGMTACYLIEAAEPRAARHALQTSGDPFDAWYRERWAEVHDGPGEFSEAVFDSRLGAGAWRGWLGRTGRGWRR